MKSCDFIKGFGLRKLLLWVEFQSEFRLKFLKNFIDTCSTKEIKIHVEKLKNNKEKCIKKRIAINFILEFRKSSRVICFLWSEFFQQTFLNLICRKFCLAKDNTWLIATLLMIYQLFHLPLVERLLIWLDVITFYKYV